MKKVTTEFSIVVVCENKINPDKIIKSEIKEILSIGFEQAVNYIEIPDVAIFDYFNNPAYPVQVNLQGKKIVFMINIKPENDKPNFMDDLCKKFVNDFIKIISLKSVISEIGTPKAVGYNIAYSTSPDENETSFSTIMNKLNDVCSDKGSVIANGFTLVKKKNETRYQIAVSPVLPEIDSTFNNSYRVNINEHFEPISGWPDMIKSSFKQFISESDSILDELNG